MSCCPHADQILGTLAASHKTLNGFWTRRIVNDRVTGDNYVVRNISRVLLVKEDGTDGTCSMNGEIIDP